MFALITTDNQVMFALIPIDNQVMFALIPKGLLSYLKSTKLFRIILHTGVYC